MKSFSAGKEKPVMRILVKVKPNSKKESVEKNNDTDFVLSVKSAAKEGKANEAVIKLLSRYFDLPKSRIVIKTGHKSRNKIIDLEKF